MTHSFGHPASAGDRPEQAKPRAAPVEDDVLECSGHMQGEQGNEQMVRDVMHLLHELVQAEVGVRRKGYTVFECVRLF